MNVTFIHTGMNYAYLGNADFNRIDYAECGGYCGECNLTNAHLKFADLTNAILTVANLTNADFTLAIVNNAYFMSTIWLNTICTDGIAYDTNQG